MLSFKNLFKSKDIKTKDLVENMLQDFLEAGGFSLSFLIEEESKEKLVINIFGEDEDLLKAKHGRFLLALQIYLNRVIRHHCPDQKIFVSLDSNGFFEEKDQRLFDLVERLREKVVNTGQPMYLRKALPPFQRKKIHEFLAEDTKVESSSVGEGFYKNICISPYKSQGSF